MSKSSLVLKKEEGGSPSLGTTMKTEKLDFTLHPSPPRDDMEDIVKQAGPLKKEEGLPSSLSVDRLEPKPEPEASSSETLNLNNRDLTPPKLKFSPTSTPPPLMASASGATSMASTPSPEAVPANSKKARTSTVQLIGDLPIARKEALASFNEIIENNYQYKTLGRSREALESMTCDCVYEHGHSDSDDACGPGSDCINRLTQVECLPDDCRCRSHCQNQRFQQRQYANIDIVLTEKKGYGLRAEGDIPRDAFIYEYVGDVVNPVSFKKRMRDYATEGIQHFYFMMLQKDEFIDATKSGGIGRFANHSCKPNCYVAKWTVGQHVRMGIFAKRDIKKCEELTFNYNVDRYGHQAQTCYCGELNCLGYIGGKTQTDLSTVDDLYLDALGITDEADLLELKGSKKKKGKKIDDPDFMPTLKSLSEKDVPKLVQAIRQTQSRKMLLKFLSRIRMTEDQAALRQIMRLRGYSLMTNVLEDYASDVEMMILVLESINIWPLMNRNKVDDSKISVPVRAIAEKEDLLQSLKDLAQSLLTHWESLPLYNRIPKRVKKDGEQSDEEMPSVFSTNDNGDEFSRFTKRLKTYEEVEFVLAPVESKPRAPSYQMPVLPLHVPPKTDPFSKESVRAVIAAANEAKAAQEAEAAKALAEKEAETKAKVAAREERRKAKVAKKAESQVEKEANKEKRLKKLVGSVVVKYMSGHTKFLGREDFKKYAQELTQSIADKEKKSSSYKDSKLDQLSEEKIAKIKKFSKDYLAKLQYKMKKKRKADQSQVASSSTVQATPASTATPDSTDGVDVVMTDMTMEEALGLNPGDSDPESEGEEDEGEKGVGASSSPAESAPQSSAAPVGQYPMDLDEQEHFSVLAPSDPRRRPPIDDPTFNPWEPPQMDMLSATN